MKIRAAAGAARLWIVDERLAFGDEPLELGLQGDFSAADAGAARLYDSPPSATGSSAETPLFGATP
jgi:hypothetical protein